MTAAEADCKVNNRLSRRDFLLHNKNKFLQQTSKGEVLSDKENNGWVEMGTNWKNVVSSWFITSPIYKPWTTIMNLVHEVCEATECILVR